MRWKLYTTSIHQPHQPTMTSTYLNFQKQQQLYIKRCKTRLGCDRISDNDRKNVVGGKLGRGVQTQHSRWEGKGNNEGKAARRAQVIPLKMRNPNPRRESSLASVSQPETTSRAIPAQALVKSSDEPFIGPMLVQISPPEPGRLE